MQKEPGEFRPLLLHVKENIRGRGQRLRRGVADDAEREKRNSASLAFGRNHFRLHIDGRRVACLREAGAFRRGIDHLGRGEKVGDMQRAIGQSPARHRKQMRVRKILCQE